MARPGTLPRGISLYRGRYRARLTVDGETHALGMFDALGDAKAALAIAKGEAVRGAFVPPSAIRAQRRAVAEREAVESLTVGEWAQSWLAEMDANPKRSHATVVSYTSVLRNHVLPTLGEVRLVDLTTHQVAELLSELRVRPSARHPGAKANGVTHTTTIVLRSMINSAVKREIGGLTAFRFPEAVGHVRVRPAEEDGDVATPAEVAAMAEAMPAHLRIAVPLAAWCALRLGEVLGLERRDLEHLDDPARAKLHVRRQWNAKAHAITDPKADSARSIAIPRFLLPDLVTHLDAFTSAMPTSTVLRGRRRDERVSQTAFDNSWRQARKDVRPTFRFHDLRHTGLTIYAQQGATLAELLHRGGHSDVSVALRYQHATVERDRALTDRLSEAISI
ncbi:site-specific integrase [Pseudactinotalea suaedae]